MQGVKALYFTILWYVSFKRKLTYSWGCRFIGWFLDPFVGVDNSISHMLDWVIWILPMRGFAARESRQAIQNVLRRPEIELCKYSWFIWKWVFVHSQRCIYLWAHWNLSEATKIAPKGFCENRPTWPNAIQLALAGLVRYLEKSQHAFHCPRREWGGGVWGPFCPGDFRRFFCFVLGRWLAFREWYFCVFFCCCKV